ncbi:MAG: MarR family transcriptional regulator [Ruminococcus sp.]|nr:MarR family transcriptional regulator [Ruminococcus sp.]
MYRRNICGLFDRDEFKFTKTQQLILMTLWLHKKLSLTELSEQICTSNEQATRAVGQLVKSGFVNRVKNQTNRRSIEISLTQKGVDLIKGSQATAAKRIPQRFDELSDEDAKTLVDCLEKIGEILI